MNEKPTSEQVDPVLKRVLAVIAVFEFLGLSAVVTYWLLR